MSLCEKKEEKDRKTSKKDENPKAGFAIEPTALPFEPVFGQERGGEKWGYRECRRQRGKKQEETLGDSS